MTDSRATSPDDVRGMLRELTLAATSLHAMAEMLLRPIGESLSRWHAIDLYAESPATVSAVARAMSRSRQYVQRITDDMVRDGLVEPLPNPAHRRSPLFATTEAGRDELRRMEDAVAGWISFLTERVSPTEVADTRAVVQRLRSLADEARAHDALPEAD